MSNNSSLAVVTCAAKGIEERSGFLMSPASQTAQQKEDLRPAVIVGDPEVRVIRIPAAGCWVLSEIVVLKPKQAGAWTREPATSATADCIMLLLIRSRVGVRSEQHSPVCSTCREKRAPGCSGELVTHIPELSMKTVGLIDSCAPEGVIGQLCDPCSERELSPD